MFPFQRSIAHKLNKANIILEPADGFEPTTACLQSKNSAIELSWHKMGSWFYVALHIMRGPNTNVLDATDHIYMVSPYQAYVKHLFQK